MNNLISIIIPIYNTEKYLRQCLDSVVNQTYKNLEIVLVNDGSTDSSLEICKEYKEKDDRIIIIDKKNSGVSNSRNVGIETSNGEYITFLDSDDWLELDAIEIMMNFVIKKDVDIVRSNFIANEEAGAISNKLKNRIVNPGNLKLLYHILNAKLPAYMYLFLVKKTIITNNQIKLNENIIMMEDTLFVIELINKCSGIYISDEITHNYRVYEGSSSNSIKRLTNNIKSILLVNKEINTIIKDNKLMEVANRTEFRIICDYLMKMYKYDLDEESKNEILTFLENDSIFNRMIKNFNYYKLSKYNKEIYKVFLNNVHYKTEKIVFKYKGREELKGVLKYKWTRIYNKYLKKLLFWTN